MIPPTRHTSSSVCCHQGENCGVSRRAPADWRTASYIRLTGSSTLSRLCPPSPLLPHAPLNSDPLTPLRSFHSPLPLHTHCDQHQSLCTALDWPHSTTSYDSWIKSALQSFCHFKQTDKLFCTTPIVSTLLVYIFNLYLSVFYILLLVFSVICMHQGSESNAISILCMYMWKYNLNLFINGVPIEQVTVLGVVLGVMLGNTLSWSKHIDNIVSTMGKGIAVARKCSAFIPSSPLKDVVQSLVLSHPYVIVKFFGETPKKTSDCSEQSSQASASLSVSGFVLFS